MNCKEIREMYPENWAAALNRHEKEQFLSHLAECTSCREEWESLSELWSALGRMPSEEPGPVLRNRFYSMLEGYSRDTERHDRESARKRVTRFGLQPALQVAAAVILLACGFIAGYLMRSARNGHQEVAGLRAEMHQMRQMMTISLLKQQSASERLKGVSWSSQVSRPHPEFLSTLVNTLNHDTNVDVRLAAVDALARFGNEPAIRRELVKSLPRQDSPLVQISLIDLLVQLHEQQSIKALERLVNDANQNPEVRERARWGLQNLS